MAFTESERASKMSIIEAGRKFHERFGSGNERFDTLWFEAQRLLDKPAFYDHSGEEVQAAALIFTLSLEPRPDLSEEKILDFFGVKIERVRPLLKQLRYRDREILDNLLYNIWTLHGPFSFKEGHPLLDFQVAGGLGSDGPIYIQVYEDGRITSLQQDKPTFRRKEGKVPKEKLDKLVAKLKEVDFEAVKKHNQHEIVRDGIYITLNLNLPDLKGVAHWETYFNKPGKKLTEVIDEIFEFIE
jgi:hypothetical protein